MEILGIRLHQNGWKFLNLHGFLNLEQGVWKDKQFARKDKFGIRCYGQEMEGVKGLEGDCCDGLTVCLTNVHFFALLSGVNFAKAALSSSSLLSLSLNDDSFWVHPWSTHLLLWVPLWYFTPLSPCLSFFSGTEYVFAVLLIEVSMLTSVFIRYATAAATVCTGMARFLYAAGLGSIHMREWLSDGSHLTCLTRQPQSLIMGCTQACNNNWNGPRGIVDIVFFNSFRVAVVAVWACSMNSIACIHISGVNVPSGKLVKICSSTGLLKLTRKSLSELSVSDSSGLKKLAVPDLSQFPRLVYKVLLIHM